MKRFVGIVVTMVFVVCLCSREADSDSGQHQNAVRRGSMSQEDQQRNVQRLSEKIEAETRLQERDKPLLDYLQWPPQERVRLWKKGTGVRGLSQRDMEDALIARGQDAVPYLVEILRHGDFFHRVYALKILCEMDRFVAEEEMPLPEVGPFIYVKPLRWGGRLNQFMAVDGRRIGKEGYVAVKWATEQTKDKDLRFHARHYAGLLKEDLRQLSLNERVKQWREAVAKSKGPLGLVGDKDNYVLSLYLGDLLIEEAPESLPLLISILDNDSSGYVREEALSLLHLVDLSRMRLRVTDIGLRAIESMHRALQRGGLKPAFENREWREEEWKKLSGELFNDEVDISNGSTWSIVAMAFEKFYGLQVTKRYYTGTHLVEAIPEFRQFISYLTKVDPYFPGWEYSFTRLLPADQVLHPRFKQKIARYYEQWKRFKAEQKSKDSKTPSSAKTP